MDSKDYLIGGGGGDGDAPMPPSQPIIPNGGGD